MAGHVKRLDSVSRILNPKDLAFLHIPKTGGASVIQALDQLFDESAIAQAYNPPDFEVASGASLYRGHMYGEQQARLFPQADHFTIARDPVATMRSMFQWMKSGGRAELWREDSAASNRIDSDDEALMRSSMAAVSAVGAMSFVQALSTRDRTVSQRMTAIHVRSLSNGRMFDMANRDVHVGQAAAAVDRCSVVGTTEDLEMALWLLCDHRKWPAPASLERIHAGKSKGRDGEKAARALARRYGEDEIYDRIRRRAERAAALLVEKAQYRECIGRYLDRQADTVFFKRAPTAETISYAEGNVWPGTGWGIRERGPAGHSHRLGANGRSVLFARVPAGSACRVTLTVRTSLSDMALLSLVLIAGGMQLLPAQMQFGPTGCILEWQLEPAVVGSGNLRLTFETLGKAEHLALSSVVIASHFETASELVAKSVRRLGRRVLARGSSR